MMKRFLMTVILAGALSVGFTSCSKDEAPDAPSIEAIENAQDDMVLTVGESVTFTATVLPSEQTEYQWTLDGQNVSTALSYTFQAEQSGEYLLKFTATNVSGSDMQEFRIQVVLYKGGFFVVNEGWFGHEMGSVDYFADAQTRTPAVYKAANPGKELGNTSCYGVKWEENYYFVSKQGRRLVKVSAADFKDAGEYVASITDSDADGRSFAGIDEDYGVYTTAKGAYIVDLNTMTSVHYLEGSKGAARVTQCGGAIAVGNYIFVINTKDGVYVYSKADYSPVGQGVLCPATIGFVRTPDGKIWASDGSTLYCIDASDLSVTTTALPEGLSVYTDRWAWKPAMFDASATENVLYFASATGSSVQNIYRYQVGNPASLAQPFAKGGTDDFLSGGGFRVDPSTGDLVAVFTGVSWGDNHNKLVVFDGTNGAEKSRLTYEAYLFPELILFND